MVSIEKRFI